MFNKVIYKGTEILNVSNDTVVAEALHAGYTAHNSNGVSITGTAKTYEEGYAAGQAAGGGGSSDPAAEAVMALVRMATRTQAVINSDIQLPMGVFLCIERGSGAPSFPFIIIPESVTALPGDQLSGSTGTESGTQIILCLPVTPPTADWFGQWSANGGNCPPKVIYVPDDSVDAYKAAENWSEFADLIKPMSELTSGDDEKPTTLAPGLYDDSGNFTPWDDLISGGMLTVSNGVLSRKDHYEGLVGTLVISGDVTSIGNNAFVDNSGLTSVQIPEGVTSIGYDAFACCFSLTSVTIPGSVTNIGRAFINCNPSTIHYNGTMEQWNSISNRAFDLPDSIYDTHIICIDGVLDVYGEVVDTSSVTFTLVGREYTVEEGTTWGEFVNSYDSEASLTINSENEVCYDGTKLVYSSDNSGIFASDYILAGNVDPLGWT